LIEELKKEMLHCRDVVENFFIENQHLMNEIVDSYGHTPFHTIADLFDFEKLRNFFAKIDLGKVNFNAQDKNGDTALHRVISVFNDENKILLLLEIGAKFNIKNTNDMTAKEKFELYECLYRLRVDNPDHVERLIEKIREILYYDKEKAVYETLELDFSDKKVVDEFLFKVKKRLDLDVEEFLGEVNLMIESPEDKDLKVVDRLLEVAEDLCEISMENNKENFINHGADYFETNDPNPKLLLGERILKGCFI